MLVRQFALLRTKPGLTRDWEFPLSHDEALESPLAGPLTEAQRKRLDVHLGRFPFARRTQDGRKAWRIEVPHRGWLEAWITSDGSLFLEGTAGLNAVYGLYVHLLELGADFALEDCITGVLHNRASLLRLVRRDEEKRLPFHLDTPFTTPPLAA